MPNHEKNWWPLRPVPLQARFWADWISWMLHLMPNPWYSLPGMGPPHFFGPLAMNTR
jgi:hypothetical protein